MNKIRYFIGLWAAKFSVVLLKVTKHNGTNFPGVIALKLCPDFLKYIGKPKQIIAVTGTNGKTTVSNLIIDMLATDGKNVLNNRLGSNINTGISTSLINGATLFGKSKYDLAVFEVDERSAIKIFPFVKPDLLLITNLSRDSIMRNGHPEYIANILNEYIPKQTKLILNADDLISVGVAPENSRVYFGIDKMDTDISECINLINDMQICPKCHSVLKYKYLRYHHIGNAYCPSCGFASPEYDYKGYNVDIERMTADILDKDGTFSYKLINDSIFNIYNVVSTVALFREMGYSQEKTGELLNKTKIISSRYNSETVESINVVMQLAKDKNALGCSRAFDYVSNLPGEKELILMMSNLDDAKHWSENTCWLYDCDFEFLNKENITNIIVTGPRAADYKLRLLLAGIANDRIITVPEEMETPNYLKLNENESVYVMYGTDTIGVAEKIVDKIKNRINERSNA